MEPSQALAIEPLVPHWESALATGRNFNSKGQLLSKGTWRTATFVLALGAAVIPASGSSASAVAHETYRTSCLKNDCVRFVCDELGQSCLLLGYFDRREEVRPACNEYNETMNSFTPPPRDCENEYGNKGPYYHYRNHFDPDNDYEEYSN
jgi:hypothetical protein